ncbi:hypothetical protein FN846DRAFT_916906 [Sphaerosporella brunnea]|uniref:Uncharacterized protein n=1 Tax=Sphaerosporella brunnea TaxID=1250544 RepID=A0A5J5F6N0_9PEZI|nr:hypothetical protein FN846DRAFT_916906 [Sphaerosporella brunnea]
MVRRSKKRSHAPPPRQPLSAAIVWGEWVTRTPDSVDGASASSPDEPLPPTPISEKPKPSPSNGDDNGEGTSNSNDEGKRGKSTSPAQNDRDHESACNSDACDARSSLSKRESLSPVSIGDPSYRSQVFETGKFDDATPLASDPDGATLTMSQPDGGNARGVGEEAPIGSDPAIHDQGESPPILTATEEVVSRDSPTICSPDDEDRHHTLQSGVEEATTKASRSSTGVALDKTLEKGANGMFEASAGNDMERPLQQEPTFPMAEQGVDSSSPASVSTELGPGKPEGRSAVRRATKYETPQSTTQKVIQRPTTRADKRKLALLQQEGVSAAQGFVHSGNRVSNSDPSSLIDVSVLDGEASHLTENGISQPTGPSTSTGHDPHRPVPTVVNDIAFAESDKLDKSKLAEAGASSMPIDGMSRVRDLASPPAYIERTPHTVDDPQGKEPADDKERRDTDSHRLCRGETSGTVPAKELGQSRGVKASPDGSDEAKSANAIDRTGPSEHGTVSTTAHAETLGSDAANPCAMKAVHGAHHTRMAPTTDEHCGYISVAATVSAGDGVPELHGNDGETEKTVTGCSAQAILTPASSAQAKPEEAVEAVAAAAPQHGSSNDVGGPADKKGISETAQLATNGSAKTTASTERGKKKMRAKRQCDTVATLAEYLGPDVAIPGYYPDPIKNPIPTRPGGTPRSKDWKTIPRPLTNREKLLLAQLRKERAGVAAESQAGAQSSDVGPRTDSNEPIDGSCLASEHRHLTAATSKGALSDAAPPPPNDKANEANDLDKISTHQANVNSPSAEVGTLPTLKKVDPDADTVVKVTKKNPASNRGGQGRGRPRKVKEAGDLDDKANCQENADPLLTLNVGPDPDTVPKATKKNPASTRGGRGRGRPRKVKETGDLDDKPKSQGNVKSHPTDKKENPDSAGKRRLKRKAEAGAQDAGPNKKTMYEEWFSGHSMCTF